MGNKTNKNNEENISIKNCKAGRKIRIKDLDVTCDGNLNFIQNNKYSYWVCLGKNIFGELNNKKFVILSGSFIIDKEMNFNENCGKEAKKLFENKNDKILLEKFFDCIEEQYFNK